MTSEKNLMQVPVCCNKPSILRTCLYDGGYGDSGVIFYFQCNECGRVQCYRTNKKYIDE